MTENNTDYSRPDTEPSSEDAFALIGNEIRVEIIRVLGDTRGPEDSSQVLSFSELRSRTDTDLTPSQLNYHLQKLVGHFVEKIDGGYALRSEGIHLYSALQAGIFDRQEKRMSVDAGFDCYYCQASVEAIFSGGRAKVECPDCEYRYLTKSVVPPFGTFEDEAALFEQFSKYIHHKLLGYASGICQICGNVLGTELVLPEEVPGSGVERSKVYVNRSCDHCGAKFYLFMGVALVLDPGLISFCYNHSVDILSTPFWELEFVGTDKHVTVRSTDPWEVALQVTIDDDTLELVVNGDLTVLERNRLDVSDGGSPSLLRGIQSGVRLMGSRESEDEVGLPDSAACLRYLRRHRWPDGVTCPHCDSVNTIKKGTTSKGAQRYRCHTCDSIFNDLTGTIFAEHRLTLPEMFHIIQEMEEEEAAQIARQLDRSNTAILDFMSEVRDAHDGPPSTSQMSVESTKSM